MISGFATILPGTNVIIEMYLQVTKYNPVPNRPTITVDTQNICGTNTYCAIFTDSAVYPSVLAGYGMEDLDISKKIEIQAFSKDW